MSKPVKTKQISMFKPVKTKPTQFFQVVLPATLEAKKLIGEEEEEEMEVEDTATAEEKEEKEEVEVEDTATAEEEEEEEVVEEEDTATAEEEEEEDEVEVEDTATAEEEEEEEVVEEDTATAEEEEAATTNLMTRGEKKCGNNGAGSKKCARVRARTPRELDNILTIEIVRKYVHRRNPYFLSELKKKRKTYW
ncbi:hypothetical protein Patl1_35686 [Pistacia atlantica]|nr:hypothetical protein Patl1_35686 [Pistacia atlantica]